MQHQWSISSLCFKEDALCLTHSSADRTSHSKGQKSIVFINNTAFVTLDVTVTNDRLLIISRYTGH